MPVEETTTLTISCDNPACPGNDLDPSDRIGWLFITHEVYGQPTQSNVYCCAMCVSNAAAAADDGTVDWAGNAVAQPQEAPVA
jgi:hypothetical protein